MCEVNTDCKHASLNQRRPIKSAMYLVVVPHPFMTSLTSLSSVINSDVRLCIFLFILGTSGCVEGEEKSCRPPQHPARGCAVPITRQSCSCLQKQQAIHGLQFEAAKTVTNLQQRVVDADSDSSGAYNDKGYLPQIPKNFTDKADEWRSWQKEIADCVGTMTPGMLKVLAEIDQEMDVH